MKLSKKDIEKKHLNKMQKLCSCFPAGVIKDEEEPDFLICSGDNVTGIEITDLFWSVSANNNPRQEQENLRSRIAERVKSKCDEEGIKLYISLHYLKQKSLNKQNVDEISNKLLSIIKNNIPNDGVLSKQSAKKFGC